MNRPTEPIATLSLAPPALSAERLLSLDAYRGLTMVLLSVEGFELHRTAQSFPDSPVWRVLGYQFEHSDWTGCTLWDLILPSFMFMVGASTKVRLAARDRSMRPNLLLME